MFNRFSSSAGQTNGSTGFFGAPAPTAQPPQPVQPTSSPFNPFGAPITNTAQSLATPSGAPAPPYAVTNELENGITIKLLSVSAMPAYRHLSQEEIRVDDYIKGRKGPSAFPGSKPGAFSQPFSTTSTGGFGSTGTSGFGTSGSIGTGGFGASSSTGFGSSTGGFGAGGFGSTSNISAPAAPQSSTFGGFGAPTTSATSSNTFGASPFRPSTGFGSGTTGAFGSSSSVPAPTTTGSNLFGSSGFGSSAPSSGFVTSGPSSGFGTTTPSSGFGGFGSSSTTATTSAPTSSSFSSGLFGQPSQSQPQQVQTQGFSGFGSSQPASTGLFGAKPVSSTGLFGSTPATPSAPSTTSLFGQSQTGFGGFGTQPTQQPAQSSGFGGGGLFGSQPQSSQLQSQPQTSSQFGFGAPATSTATTNTTSAPFGSFGSQPQQQPSGLFSSGGLNSFRPSAPVTTTNNSTTSQFAFPQSSTPLPPAPSTSMFPSSGNSGFGGSSFFSNKPTSATTSTPAIQSIGSTSLFPTFGGTTTSTIGSNIGGSIGTTTSSMNFPNVAPPTTTTAGSLSLAPPLPSIYSTSRSQATQTAPIVQVPPKSPVKFTPRTSFRIKPRESYNLSTPIPLNFGLSSNGTNEHGGSSVLVPRKLVNNSVNMKKLVIPEFTEDSSIESSIPVKSVSDTSASHAHVTSHDPQPQSQNILTDSMSYGQQYTFPPIKILKSSSDRREIKNFVIGQKGIGEIRFLVPVDLSEIDPESLFGHFVEFCDGEAVLYPDPQIPKPEPGRGLNLPAQVRLERIWAHSKGSRDPILDPQNEKVVLFAQKLKETEGTNFVSYDPIGGTWTFTVDHF